MPVALFSSLLLLLLNPSSALTIGSAGGGGNIGGIGVWIGGGGGGSGGGGGVAQQNPPPSSSDPAVNGAYTALQAWKSAITEDPNKILATWVGPNVCSYRGIFCSDPPDDVSSTSSTQVVAVIDLNKASLRGTLVPELSLLAHLSAIHLNSNRLTGTVPDSFGDLQYLSELDLSNNLLSGPFPSAALTIPNLVYLDLRYNRFSGEIPEELFEKGGLDAIFLNNNLFDGEVPTTLWTTPASVVNLANNRLAGALPSPSALGGSIGLLGPSGGGELREALFLNNKLAGCIPEGVGSLANAEVLDFSFNSFTGHLPSSLSCLTGIEVLNIAHNQLSGVVHDELCSLRSLVNLSISFNFFSGFSQDCTRLAFRNVGFDFSGNCISGRELQRPPPECSGGVPGIGLSCFGMPLMKPILCGTVLGWQQQQQQRAAKLPTSATRKAP